MNSIVARKRILLFSETEELALCCLSLTEQGWWNYMYTHIYVCVSMHIYVDQKSSSCTLSVPALCPSNPATSAYKGLCISIPLYPPHFWTLPPQKAPDQHFGTDTVRRRQSKFQVTKCVLYHHLSPFSTNPSALSIGSL